MEARSRLQSHHVMGCLTAARLTTRAVSATATARAALAAMVSQTAAKLPMRVASAVVMVLAVHARTRMVVKGYGLCIQQSSAALKLNFACAPFRHLQMLFGQIAAPTILNLTLFANRTSRTPKPRTCLINPRQALARAQLQNNVGRVIQTDIYINRAYSDTSGGTCIAIILKVTCVNRRQSCLSSRHVEQQR